MISIRKLSTKSLKALARFALVSGICSMSSRMRLSSTQSAARCNSITQSAGITLKSSVVKLLSSVGAEKEVEEFSSS